MFLNLFFNNTNTDVYQYDISDLDHKICLSILLDVHGFNSKPKFNVTVESKLSSEYYVQHYSEFWDSIRPKYFYKYVSNLFVIDYDNINKINKLFMEKILLKWKQKVLYNTSFHLSEKYYINDLEINYKKYLNEVIIKNLIE